MWRGSGSGSRFRKRRGASEVGQPAFAGPMGRLATLEEKTRTDVQRAMTAAQVVWCDKMGLMVLASMLEEALAK